MKTRLKNYDLRFMNVLRFTFIFLIFNFALLTYNLSEVQAQTVTPAPVDPTAWQTGANGLLTTSNDLNKTAGLGLQVRLLDNRSWPFLISPGGVYENYGHLTPFDYVKSNLVGIELGRIQIPGVSTVANIQTADWVYNTININSSQLNLTVSRLSLAALVNTASNSLRLFAGNVIGATTNGATVANRAAAPSYPKYAAFHTTNGYQVRSLSTTNLSFTGNDQIDQNWLLVWYGNNSHFVDTKNPTSYSPQADWGSSTIPMNYGYQADAPMLLTFQNNPSSIIQSPEGGIDLNFSSEAGNLSVMPLFGRDHPQASTTEEWGSSGTLPSSGAYNVISKLNFWVPRTCNFPKSVAESYNYDPSTDTASITDNITFTNICSSTPTFAPIPPMLAIAKNTLGVTFSGTLVDSNTHTEFGPLQGIENTNTYTWNLSGLKKYTDNKRVVNGTGSVPQSLIDKLTNQVDEATKAGHLAPWIFNDSVPNGIAGDIYWLNPAENLYFLSEIVPALPEPQKTNLINYLKTERNNSGFNPEVVYNLPLNQGKIRGDYALSTQAAFDSWSYNRPDTFLDHVPLYSFFGLASYYEITADTLSVSLMTSAKASINKDLANMDWATFSKFQEPKSVLPWTWRKRREEVVEQNRLFAGLVGLVKLSKTSGDQNTENLARALLARTAVTRLAILQYPRYLYTAGQVVLPASANWQVSQLRGMWQGYIINYNWTGPNDDPRQVGILDQFETRLLDSTDDAYQIVPYYTAYRDMVPELFRFLSDYAKPELEIYRNKIQTMQPNWYAAFAEAILGTEHGLTHPVDSYQLFMEQALVAKDNPQNLNKYLDIPWISAGDFFYLHKLAETIKAYQGWKWEDEDIGVGIPGDVNYDAQVDVLDIQSCVNHILGIQDQGGRADVNQDGSVDVLDVQNIVNIILGV